MIVSDHAARLGHRPHLDQCKTETLFKNLMLTGFDTGTQRETYRVLALLFAGRQLEQNIGNDTLKLHDRRARGDDILPPCAGMKAVRKNQAAP